MKARAGPVAAALALASLVLLGYQGLRHNGFVSLDDPAYVTENPHIRAGLTATSALWALGATREGNWHPLTWLSHASDVGLFGFNPAGHHATSLALHLASTLLLFVALARMTGRLPPSLLAAALFGVHPAGVESVAWVAERKDVLSGLLFVLCLLLYQRFVRTRRTGPYLLLCASFALGLASKPTLVTLPFVLLLLDHWPFDRFAGRSGEPRRALLEKLPLLLIAAACAGATLVAQRHAGAMDNPAEFTLARRLANTLVAYGGYLGKTLWPEQLAVFYPFELHLPAWKTLGAGLLLAALTAGAASLARTRGYVAVGWFWFAGMLIPMSGLVQVGGQAMADRYLYLPGIGLWLAAAWSLDAAAAGRRPLRRTALWGAAVAVTVGLAARTSFQVAFWQDSERLYRHALAVVPENFFIRTILGVELQRQGRVDEAEREFRGAIAHHPGYGPAWQGLGVLQGARGRYQEAATALGRAVELRPGNALARLNLGLALEMLGRFPQAVTQYEEAARLDPGDPRAREYLSQARWRGNRAR